MVSNNDIYSKLQSYKNTLDDYIEQTKKHPDDVRASPAFDNIFRDIQAINGLPESTAGLTSDAARNIFPTPAAPIPAPDHNKVLKREIRHLNKSIVSAKYQSEVQGLNWFQRIPVWFKYHFSSPEKLGIARLDVRHLVDLMKAANVKKDVTDVTNEKLQNTTVRSDSEAFGQLNDVVQKLGATAAHGTYLLLEDKSGIFIIEADGNIPKFTKYTFKDENGLCAVFDKSKARVGTFKDRESFLKQKQIDAAIAYIKDPKFTVEKDQNKYVKIETGRTKEGKEITLVLKNSEGLVATNQYILPNGITQFDLVKDVKSGLVKEVASGSYFNREEFFQAKAKELHVPFITSTVASGHADAVGTVAEAHEILKNKPVGSWTSTLKDAKSEAVFLIVVDNKNTVKEFTFKEMPNKAPEAIRPFLEAATTKQIVEKDLVSFIPISAQKKRIAQGEALKRIIFEGDITQSKLIEAMNEADKATQGKSSFVVKAVAGKPLTEFTITARPTKSNSFDSNNRVITVLPDGRIQHDKGRIFENFEAYKAAELLSTSLPEALIQRHLGAPVLNAPTDLPANTYLFWADKADPSKLFLSNKTAAGIETYQIGNMKFDNTGEATFQLQGKNAPKSVKQSELAKPFGDGVLSSQQREVIARLKEMVATETIGSAKSLLNTNEKGYLLTTSNSATSFNYKLVDKGYTDVLADETEYTLRVLPDGRIAQEQKVDNEVKLQQIYADMSTFKKELSDKKSIKDLAYLEKVGKENAAKIRGFITNISQSTGASWTKDETTARTLMEDAKTLDLPQNQVVFFRNGNDSSRITLLFQRDGKLQEGTCDVKEDGKLLVTVPPRNVTTVYTTIDEALKANSLEKATTIQTQIQEKRAIIQAGVDKLKATDGFDSDKIAATNITEALTSHIEEQPSMDAMVGAWMLAQVVEVIPANWWRLQGETINETGRFKLAVNVGDKEEDMKIVEHTVSVNSRGEFILDGDATKPKKTIDEVLTSVGAKKDLSLGQLKAIEDKWKVIEDEVKSDAIGSYVEPENMDLMQVWETQFKTKQGTVLITDNGPGEYSLSCKNGEVDVAFSTRQVPGKVVDSATSKQYNTVKELIGAYEIQLRPWKPEHERNLKVALENAPKQPGVAATAYNAAASATGYLVNLGWSFIAGGNQTATVNEPVAVGSPPKSPQMQQPAAGGGASPKPAAQQQEPVAPVAQPQAQAPVANAAIGPTLANMKPAFLNKGKYFKFGGKQVTKAQTTLMKEVIAWKNANTALSSQDAKAALKLLLLNDNYEQSQGFNDLAQIQALAKDIIPYPSGVNMNERNATLAWLWAASKQ